MPEKKFVASLKEWDAIHVEHGAPSFEDHRQRYQWRICPCGARLLEFKPGEISSIGGILDEGK